MEEQGKTISVFCDFCFHNWSLDTHVERHVCTFYRDNLGEGEHTYHTYHFGLKVSLSGKYCGPLYFMCGLKTRVVCRYMNERYIYRYTHTHTILAKYPYS